jgi:hypothetical protein
MTAMPTISDRMVNEFRRTGRRGSSYSLGRSSRSAGSSAHVAPQSNVTYNPCIGKLNNTSCGEDCYCCDGFPKYGSPC